MGPRRKPGCVILLKEHNKTTLDDILLTIPLDQRVHHSTFIRDASSCHRWQRRDPQLINIQRIKDFGLLSRKWDVYHTPLIKAHGSMWKMRWKDLRTRGGGYLQGSSVFQTQQGRCTHKLTKTGNTHKTLIRKSQTKFLGERKTGRHKDPPLDKELLAFECSYVRKSQFSSME